MEPFFIKTYCFKIKQFNQPISRLNTYCYLFLYFMSCCQIFVCDFVSWEFSIWTVCIKTVCEWMIICTYDLEIRDFLQDSLSQETAEVSYRVVPTALIYSPQIFYVQWHLLGLQVNLQEIQTSLLNKHT